MSRFIQLHLLTSYPPANLNRDDLGRPKTAKMGGFDRLRVSSQCLKRTWRTSEIFENAINKGIRTKMIGRDAFEKLSKFPALSKTEREKIAKDIAKAFGSLKGDSLELDTLAFVSDSERANIDKIILGFQNGLGSATVESNSFGVHLFKVLSADIQTSLKALIGLLKSGNEVAHLKDDWDKPKGLKEIIKTRNFKTSEDNSPYDYLAKMIDKSDEWLEEISGAQEVMDDQLELFFADEYVKLTKEVMKKLSLGALMSGQAAKETEYGAIKHKNHIDLCEGWEEQINSWVKKVIDSEDDDFTSDDNIQNLKLVVSPGAIPKSAILTNEHTNADIALFGRMLASSTEHNVEAACQVAHSISVHPTVIEDDYFTAVEEMNQYRNDAGAAHLGETRFAAVLFYSYICINRELLIKNLDGDEALANKAIRALTEASVKVAPTGKQNSFASRAYASFVLAEKGDQQPRSLSVAYLKPINHRENDDFIQDSIKALLKQRDSFDKVYGECADTPYELSVPEEKGTLAELLDFVGK
jgi:CRISPR-associated protein Cas7/Cse4/CasC subtype I-E